MQHNQLRYRDIRERLAMPENNSPYAEVWTVGLSDVEWLVGLVEWLCQHMTEEQKQHAIGMYELETSTPQQTEASGAASQANHITRNWVSTGRKQAES